MSHSTTGDRLAVAQLLKDSLVLAVVDRIVEVDGVAISVAIAFEPASRIASVVLFVRQWSHEFFESS